MAGAAPDPMTRAAERAEWAGVPMAHRMTRSVSSGSSQATEFESVHVMASVVDTVTLSAHDARHG